MPFMKRFIRFFTLKKAILACLWASFAVHAQQLPSASTNIKINRVESEIVVGKDLLSRTQIFIEREALTSQGAAAIGKFSRSVNKDLETYQIEEAYTLKANGRKLLVSADQIQRQSGVVAGGAFASQPNVEIVQVTFPDVQTGDRTIVRSVGSTRQLPLSGFYSYFDFFSPSVTIDSIKLKLTAPKTVNVFVQGKPEKFIREEGSEFTTWTLEAKVVATSMDDDAKDPLQVWPYFVASNFQNYEQLAQAYASQNNAKVKVPPQLKALVDELVAGQTDMESKARLIYDWVRHNVRYVAIYLGTDGWVPHDVDWILANRYGDCKDHALLLQSMLGAAGIEAAPALINASNAYSLVRLPTLIFDHAITYVPALGMFLDSTSLNTPFGALPHADQDRPAAVALASGAVMMRTPPESATQNTVHIHSAWNIRADGDADAEINLTATGSAATVWQDWLELIPEGMQHEAAMKILRQSGYKGNAELLFPKVQREKLEQSLHLKVHIQDFLNDTEAGSVVLHPRLSNLNEYIGQGFGYAADKRTYSITCTPITRTESFEVAFDPVFTVSRIPQGVDIHGLDGVSFVSDYHLDGNTIKGHRSLVAAQSRNICSPADYARRKPTFDLISKHLRKVVLFQQ